MDPARIHNEYSHDLSAHSCNGNRFDCFYDSRPYLVVITIAL